jgi:hypothetical protein
MSIVSKIKHEKIYMLNEVAQYLGLKPSTIKTQRSKKIPLFGRFEMPEGGHLPNGAWYLTESELGGLLDKIRGREGQQMAKESLEQKRTNRMKNRTPVL